MDRKEALALLQTHVTTDRVFKHSLAVEGAMIAYANKYGEDADRWGLMGLLHDIDYEKYPEEHPAHVYDLLGTEGFDQEFMDSIVSHGMDQGIPRDLLERKCLHAVDAMSSFIIAVALMRPTKLEGLKPKSVKKKMKDKAFAKAVDRDLLVSSMEALDMEFADHINTIVEGLIAQEARLQEDGYSLLG